VTHPWTATASESALTIDGGDYFMATLNDDDRTIEIKATNGAGTADPDMGPRSLRWDELIDITFKNEHN
jgi:hypothetical protein